MADNPEFGKRLTKAKGDWEYRHHPEKISNEEIGRRVAKWMKRDEPYSPQAVGQWFAGREPKAFEVVRALADVLECDPVELFLGRAGGSQPLQEPTKKRRTN